MKAPNDVRQTVSQTFGCANPVALAGKVASIRVVGRKPEEVIL